MNVQGPPVGPPQPDRAAPLDQLRLITLELLIYVPLAFGYGGLCAQRLNRLLSQLFRSDQRWPYALTALLLVYGQVLVLNLVATWLVRRIVRRFAPALSVLADAL